MNSWLVLGIIFITTVNAKNDEHVQSSCNQPDCLRCDLRSSQCVKCLHVMVTGTRECHTSCPIGYDTAWADDTHMFGRICQERSIMSMVSYREVWVIAGASIVGVISIGILVGIFLLRHKGAKPPPDFPPRGLPKSIQDKRPKTAEIAIKGKEREEFISRLRSLRADTPHIFQMMTSIRTRYKHNSSFGYDNPSDAKTKASKAVCRDLNRVLCLLSLKEDNLKTAPKDWRSLLLWTEKLLARYKRQEMDLNERGSGRDSGGTRSNTSSTKENRTLFITRQEKLRFEQEKRRMAQNMTADHTAFQPEKGGEHLNQFAQNIKLHDNQSKADNVEKTIIKEHWVGTSKEDETAPMKILTVKHKDDFSTTVKKKIKKLSSSLVKLKNSFFHSSSFDGAGKEEDLEKGGLKGKDSNCSKSTNGNIRFNDSDDDITSQTFFDHIEAFTFDPMEEIDVHERNVQGKPTTDPLKKKHATSQGRKNKFMNDVNRRVLKSNLNFSKESKILPAKELSRKQPKKVSNPGSKIRFSSISPAKDKRNFGSSESRSKSKIPRPLKRQKRVEKATRSKLLEKYQNKEFDESFTSDQTDFNEGRSQVSNYVANAFYCQKLMSHRSNERDSPEDFVDTISIDSLTNNSSKFNPFPTQRTNLTNVMRFCPEKVPDDDEKNWLKHHTKLEILTCV